jgi:hypothetical protein
MPNSRTGDSAAEEPQPTRYAPDWYETAVWLATASEGAHHGEVRLYRTADGRYFRFHIEHAASTEIIDEYPKGQAEQLSVEQARALYAQSASKLVDEDEAFPC